MKISFPLLVQRVFNRFGFHLRRLEKGVSLDSALSEQLRLAGPDPKVIIEIGAANGRDTERYAELCPSARIIAYEPLPENFAELEKRAEVQPRITPINAAVSKQGGRATFHVTALRDASSLKVPKTGLGTYDRYTEQKTKIDVGLVRLDDEMTRLSIDRIDLLKMDAQGAELDIIEGFASFLERKAVQVIYTEISFMKLYEDGPLYHDIALRLEAFGYRLHAMYDIVMDQSGQYAWGDAIFVPK